MKRFFATALSLALAASLLAGMQFQSAEGVFPLRTAGFVRGRGPAAAGEPRPGESGAGPGGRGAFDRTGGDQLGG